MAEANTRVREEFSLHQDMLYSIIFAQAGTLGKAFLELIMNSIDAGATFVRITLSKDGFTVTDNGRGFQSRQEIKDWFGKFGTPHEEGDAIYGRFRMGRGQIMAFASTVWTTCQFRMDVDIKHRGREYFLEELDDERAGCTIEGKLYEPLLPSEEASVLRDLETLAKYAQIPVFLNDRQINTLPSDEKWDMETDDAYMRLRDTGSLKVYNLGVFVKTIPSREFGTGGVIVSKVPLEVNFARNDILVSRCAAWKRIRSELRKVSTKSALRKARMTDAQRENLAMQLVNGELPYEEAKPLRLITDTQGKHHPLKRLVAKRGLEFTVAPEEGSRLAETIHARKLCFVVSPKTLHRFGCETGEEFAALMKKVSQDTFSYNRIRLTFVPFEEFSETLNSGHEALDTSELTPQEKVIQEAIRHAQDMIARSLRVGGFDVGKPRSIRIGVSDTAEAWTDGKRYIFLNRDLLKKADEGVRGFVVIASVLIHEYLHRESDAGSHAHDMEFYEAFHHIVADTKLNILGESAVSMFRKYTNLLRQKNLKVKAKLLRDEDNDAKLASCVG